VEGGGVQTNVMPPSSGSSSLLRLLDPEDGKLILKIEARL
jgi:hypothetical protein